MSFLSFLLLFLAVALIMTLVSVPLVLSASPSTDEMAYASISETLWIQSEIGGGVY
jgi:hypothetical protein